MPPKAPRPPKAAATGNAATGTLGVKRRVQKPKPRPEGMSDDDWAKDCHRREVNTKDRYSRKEKNEERLRAASLAAAAGSLGDGSSPTGSTSRSSSPSESPFPMAETPRAHSRFTPSPRVSPEFEEPGGYGGYAYGYHRHGGFDPNAVFAATQTGAGHSLDLNESPIMRRGAVHAGLPQSGRSLSFDAGAHHPLDESTTFGTPASSGVDDVQGDDGDGAEGDDGAEGEDADEAEEDADEAEEAEEVEEAGNEDADGAKRGKKRRAGGGGGTRGPTWTDAEDKCLIDAWSAITQEVTTGANQTSDSYWKRIKSEWDERRFHKDYIDYHMDRNQNALSHRWNAIQKATNKFHGCLEQIMSRPESGKSVKDQIIDACELYKATNNKLKSYTMLHCFAKLQNCEKWKKYRRSVKKNGVGDVDEVVASEGRPMGNKKGKAALAAAANSERVHSSIDKVLADVCKNSSERRLSCDAKWAELAEKATKKLELAKSNAALKKRREDFLILTTDTSNLDPLARAACDRLRADIYAEMGLAPAPAPAPTPTQNAAQSAQDAETQPGDQTDSQRAQDAETQPDAQGGEFTGMDFLGSTPAAGFLGSINIDD